MQTIRNSSLSAALMLSASVTYLANGQDAATAHWGVQGDAGWTNVPHFIVDKISGLPERPDITGKTFQVGSVRFHPNGAPSYALQFSQLDADLQGAVDFRGGMRQIRGAGTLRGFMATKYLNVVARKKVSGGFAFGAGIGKGEASYTRSDVFGGVAVPLESNTYDRVVPLFEILGRVDFRPVKALSIGPYYGFRNGMFAAGVAVRFHITK